MEASKWVGKALLASHCAKLPRCLASRGRQREKTNEAPWRRERKPPDNFASGGVISGTRLLGDKSRLDQLWLGHLREGAQSSQAHH